MFSIIFLLPLYAVGIQYERGGLWNILIPIVIVALMLDVILNFTELALITLDFPRKNEWTFSTRLSRLNKNTDWRGTLSKRITKVLDFLAPSGKHIRD